MALATPTASSVRLVINVPSTVADEDIDEFIADAAALVSRCSAVLALDEVTQKAIVKYVTAHLLSQRFGTAGPLISKALGDASESYAAGVRTYGTGLMSTFYGQQAVALDPTGCLERVGKMKPTFQLV